MCVLSFVLPLLLFVVRCGCVMLVLLCDVDCLLTVSVLSWFVVAVVCSLLLLFGYLCRFCFWCVVIVVVSCVVGFVLVVLVVVRAGGVAVLVLAA